ncbi:LysR family transcriptional regulator [Aliikangiella marina]|uniref:LysR family transcriptional regulator n=1 Tax=Aliikangiella marina TaxID=1712262 RepID=A0A545T9M2_9GAMM|nr:LysR family transcriptional regulator [Aliikangiella marina]TQV73905.1 LysR family transcriptional regulator [Aliikangiella marina]
MNISSKDLNLLFAFKVLFEERNLSNAAKRMALSQPALSHKLNKLRNEFDDQLFVRAARGLTITPLAEQIAPQVLQAIQSIEGLYHQLESQNFLLNEDTVHLYTTDFIEQLLLPSLLARIEMKAPKLKLVCHNTLGKLPKKELETGECDIAIAGFYHGLSDSYYQQKLKEESFVVLANSDTSKIKDHLDLEGFLACRHIITTLSGDLDGIVDKELRELNLSRKVVAGVSSFLAPPLIVKDTNCIVVCLESIARMSALNYERLSIYKCPIKLPKVNISQTWHARTHQDPMRKWLRREIHDIMFQH